jgi:hypothetical protein
MGWLEQLRKTLIDATVSEVVRERMSLAIDRLEDSDTKIAALHTQVGNLEARLEQATIDRDQIRDEYERLKKEHEDTVCFDRGIEFRRGKTTRDRWSPFCPVCHKPITSDSLSSVVYCAATKTCKSIINVSPDDLETLLGDLNSQS